MIYYLIASYLIMIGIIVKYKDSHEDASVAGLFIAWLMSPVLLPIATGGRIVK